MSAGTIALPPAVEAVMAELTELYRQVTSTMSEPGNNRVLNEQLMEGRFALGHALPLEGPKWEAAGFYDVTNDVRMVFGDLEGAGSMEGSLYTFFREGDEATFLRICWSDARSAGLHIANLPRSISVTPENGADSDAPTLSLERTQARPIKRFGPDGKTVIVEHRLTAARADHDQMVAVELLLTELAFIKRGLQLTLAVFATILGGAAS